eukprot:6365973-Prymnesium_polylepis.1
MSLCSMHSTFARVACTMHNFIVCLYQWRPPPIDCRAICRTAVERHQMHGGEGDCNIASWGGPGWKEGVSVPRGGQSGR